MNLVSLQGPVYAATRDASGNPGAFRSLGDAPTFEVQLQTDTQEHRESSTGLRLQDGRLQLGKTATVNLTLDHWTAANLALALYGTSSVVASDTVTAEALPAGLAQGDFVRLAGVDVSSVVVKDSAGTPATLVLGTDYEVTSAKHGTIRILGDLSGYTAPFRADYSTAGGTNVSMFDTAPSELWLMLDGVNTADANAPVKAELYRVLLDPVGSAALKSPDGYGSLELTGSVLYDETKASDAVLGQFGRLIEMAA